MILIAKILLTYFILSCFFGILAMMYEPDLNDNKIHDFAILNLVLAFIIGIGCSSSALIIFMIYEIWTAI